MSIVPVASNFLLNKLTYIPIGEHHPMYIRPYVTSMTEQAVNTIADRLVSENTTSVNVNQISDLTSQLLQPSAVGLMSEVDNTWVDTRKYIFILEVTEINKISGTTYNHYITGFTDYNGITNSGVGDPEMMHSINSVITTIIMNLRNNLGVVERTERIYSIYDVLSNNNLDELYTQRPTDIFSSISANDIAINMSGGWGESEALSVYNPSGTLSRYGKNTSTSMKDNLIPSMFLLKTLNTGLMNNQSRELNFGNFDVHEVSSSTVMVPEFSLSNNSFIKTLTTLSGNPITSSFFRMRDLFAMDNTISDRFNLVNLNKNYLLNDGPSVGEYWHGQDPVTVKAYSLIESSVALAIKHGFNKLTFFASNTTNPTGVTDVYVTEFHSIINLPQSQLFGLLDLFKGRFLTNIYIPESNGGVLPLDMEMHVDIYGTTKIMLSYAGYSPTWYTAPSIASSRFSPVLTSSNEAVSHLSHSMSTIMQSISNKTKQTAPFATSY